MFACLCVSFGRRHCGAECFGERGRLRRSVCWKLASVVCFEEDGNLSQGLVELLRIRTQLTLVEWSPLS